MIVTEQTAYVLGTHDEEIDRLGLQHRVWRPMMLDAWSKAGITVGSRVVDFGCGPGFATLDLAEVVGPNGTVLGIERSERFLQHCKAALDARALSNVKLVNADLTNEIVFGSEYDAAWCRWVASFVPELNQLVHHIHTSLRSGGVAVFHEYVNYSTWESIPHSPGIASFAAEVGTSWRASGGEPDIAAALIPKLLASGFKITETKPLVYAVNPRDYMWQWPHSFVHTNLSRLVEIGHVSQQWADEVQSEFDVLEQSPTSIIITPMVMQIVAVKL